MGVGRGEGENGDFMGGTVDRRLGKGMVERWREGGRVDGVMGRGGWKTVTVTRLVCSRYRALTLA